MADLPPSTIPSGSSFLDEFVCDWYIRIKLQVPSDIHLDIINETSSDVQRLWEEIRSVTSPHESQLWPQTFQDLSKSYFWFIGLPNLPSLELGKSKACLREWQKKMKEKMKRGFCSIEARFIPRKVFISMQLVEIDLARSRVNDGDHKGKDSKPAGIEKRAVKSDERDANKAMNFRKIKGSNPQQIRRHFLEHNMPGSNSSASPSTKLRPGKEILNRLKFDPGYAIANFVVGYIDREAGVLEKSVDEWVEHGDEDLIAYIKNVENGDIVWDKARKIDLVSGKDRK